MKKIFISLLALSLSSCSGMQSTSDSIILKSNKIILQSDAQNKIASTKSSHYKKLKWAVGKIRNTSEVKEIVKDGERELNFKIYVDNSVNAFALGNGSIRFTTGLTSRMSREEVLFVLAHELGHVTNKDAEKGYNLTRAFETAKGGLSVVSDKLSSLNIMGADDKASIEEKAASDVGTSLLTAQFSQTQENSADEFAIKIMKNVAVNCKNAASAINVFVKLGSSNNEVDGFFASHANPLERKRNVTKLC